MRIIVSVLLTICFCQTALADTTYVCNNGGMERIIEVIYQGAGSVPCEVRYTKDGITKVLWNAQVEEGYCDFKAKDFVEKQRSWGWQCEGTSDTMGGPISTEIYDSHPPE